MSAISVEILSTQYRRSYDGDDKLTDYLVAEYAKVLNSKLIVLYYDAYKNYKYYLVLRLNPQQKQASVSVQYGMG